MGRSETAWQTPPKLPKEDFISNLVYADPEIFALEMERVKKAT